MDTGRVPTVFWGSRDCQGQVEFLLKERSAKALILMGDWCGSVRDRRHAIENRDAYRPSYQAGTVIGNTILEKIVLNVTLPIDTGPANR